MMPRGRSIQAGGPGGLCYINGCAIGVVPLELAVSLSVARKQSEPSILAIKPTLNQTRPVKGAAQFGWPGSTIRDVICPREGERLAATLAISRLDRYQDESITS
jgi:hypothetical protein